MWAYTAQRILYAVPIALGVTVVCFALVYLAPGDPVQMLLPPDASQADVEFLKDGTWGILHYAGRREAGRYQVQGNRLIMKTDDGAVYQDAKMTWKAAAGILELDSGAYLMRLRQLKAK